MNEGKRAWAGAVAAGIALADGVSYLVVIYRQGESSPVVAWVFSAIVIGAAAALCGWLVSPRRGASTLLALSAVAFVPLGVLGIFSIGLPLLGAAGFSLFGLRQSRDRARQGSRAVRMMVGVVAAIGVLLTAWFLVEISRGGTTVSVTCSGSGSAAGMPSPVTERRGQEVLKSGVCRTVTSP